MNKRMERRKRFSRGSLVPISIGLGGPNPLELLSDDDFGKSLDEWRGQNKMIADPTAKIWAVMYLNEAERRWRPDAK